MAKSELHIAMDKEALRKKLEAMKPYTIETFHGTPGATFTYTISMCRCGLNKDITDEQCGRCNQLDLLSECSRLASRVEELEKGLREAIDTLEIAEYHVAAEKLRTVLAGAHAEEKE